jgi:hypothetical protein
VKILKGYDLEECASLCRDDHDCLGGYHANGKLKRPEVFRNYRYDPVCYLLGVEGAYQKPCSQPNTENETKFECFCDAEPKVCAREAGPSMIAKTTLGIGLLVLLGVVAACASTTVVVLWRKCFWPHTETEAVPRKADGATPEMVQALPLRKVTPEDPLLKCSICLEHMEPGTEVRTLPCDHFYHAACVDSWLKQKSSCPMCRGGISTREIRVRFSDV